MKTILVRFYSPSEVMGVTVASKQELRQWCFRVNEYPSEFDALNAYANTMCTWSTIKDTSDNIEEFIDEAIEHILQFDYRWLEHNFT